jgi:hypothetical protein
MSFPAEPNNVNIPPAWRVETIEEHKTTMKIEVRKTMNYEDYESTLYSWIFVGTVGL